MWENGNHPHQTKAKKKWLVLMFNRMNYWFQVGRRCVKKMWIYKQKSRHHLSVAFTVFPLMRDPSVCLEKIRAGVGAMLQSKRKTFLAWSEKKNIPPSPLSLYILIIKGDGRMTTESLVGLVIRCPSMPMRTAVLMTHSWFEWGPFQLEIRWFV